MWQGLKIGDVLAHRYRIQDCIGEGGMGRVFVAEDLKLSDKQWAVKEIQGDWTNPEFGREEAKLLLRLDHPQLPKIVDYYHIEATSTTYLIMELVPGRTIGQLVAEIGPIEEALVIDIAKQLCTIFSYLHELTPDPIIHRDLKPDNIIIDRQSVVYLVDFGISRTYKEEKLHDTVRLGSIGFLAPEQLRGEQSDVRTDLFQLGALLYYMLSGGTCYDRDEGLVELTGVSAEFRDLLTRLLHDQPEHRPVTAREVHAVLSDLVTKRRDGQQDQIALATSYGSNAHRIGYVIVGSAYGGAGATMTAYGLAEAIAGAGRTVGFVEYAHQPELVYRLGGEVQAPNSYVYLTDRANAPHIERSAPEWKDGNLIYYPMRPSASSESLTAEQWYAALLQVRTDAVVIDIGCHWQDVFVQAMIHHADYVICAIDDQIHKWYRSDVEQVLEQLTELRTMRPHIYTVAYANGVRQTSWRTYPLPLDLKLMRSGLVGGMSRHAFEPLLNRWGFERPHTKMKRRSLFNWMRSERVE